MLTLSRWRQPYLANDPHEWTDSTGTIRRDIQSIELKSDKWEWLGPWDLDMSTLIGESLDKDGWEYASTNFASFSVSRKRRCSSAVDCVRRRKWLRTRIPAAGSIDERFRPLLIFWDVEVLQSGTRSVTVRSNLQIRNLMPYAVMIKFGGSREGESVFGPVNQDQLFNVPLMQASASWVQTRPAEFSYVWSQQVSCCLQSNDFTSMRDAHCEYDSVSQEGSRSPVCMRILCNQQSKSLLVTIAPVVMITNRLPCSLSYVCNSSNTKRDEGMVPSGTSCKLTSVDLSFSPKFSICVGNLMWTEPRDIDPLSLDPINVNALTADGLVGAVLSVVVSVCSIVGTVNICVYSKGVLRDRTDGLGVSLSLSKGRSANGVEIVRRSFGTTDGVTVPTRILSSALEKQKRTAQLKSDERAAQKGLSKSLLMPKDDSIFIPGTSATESVDVGSSSQGVGNEQMTIECVKISNLSVHSSYVHELVNTDIGDLVYTDRALRWTHLPPQLRGQLSIRTACADEMTRSKNLLSFTVDSPCLTLLLIDVRTSRPPKWLVEGGYSKVRDQAIGRVALSGLIYETSYNIYGKYCEVGNVILEGSWCPEVHSMYGIFFVPISKNILNSPKIRQNGDEMQQLSIKSDVLLDSQSSTVDALRKLFEEVTFDESYKPSNNDENWIKGGNGLSLFCSEGNIVSVGVKVKYCTFLCTRVMSQGYIFLFFLVALYFIVVFKIFYCLYEDPFL